MLTSSRWEKGKRKGGPDNCSPVRPFTVRDLPPGDLELGFYFYGRMPFHPRKGTRSTRLLFR